MGEKTYKQEGLDEFKAKIAELKRQEEEIGESVHFKGCNPFELEEKDKNIYERLTSGILTINEIMNYKDELMKNGNNSQKIFSEYTQINISLY